MEEAVPDESDLSAAVQDDPILSRPLQKGLMEDWLGPGIYEELPMYRGKVRGVSEKRLKAKEKASGVQGVNRDLGVACGSVKFAVRVTDTKGGQSFGALPKSAIATQVMSCGFSSYESCSHVSRSSAVVGRSRVRSAGHAAESNGHWWIF